MIARLLRSLQRDERGVSAVEFAVVAPVFLTMVMGSIQFGIDIYIKSVLTGAVQQAGRNSGIEDAMPSQTAIDDKVRDQIHAILPSAAVSFNRKNYQSFSSIGALEEFIDTKESDGKYNGIFDSDECYWDENDSNTRDDGAISGQGGARDVVVYTVSVEYEELLPLKALAGLGSKRKIDADTMLMNQPFATQKPRPTPVKRGGCLT